jgi:hypothetical protein
VGGDQIKELSFFPGMNVKSAKKVEIFKNVIKALSKRYYLGNMSEYLNSMKPDNDFVLKKG